MTHFQTFSDEWGGAVHQAFIKSFSDYLLNFQPSFADFQDRIYHKLHIQNDLSIICASGGEVLGFLLHTSNSYEGQKTVYNGGTGVIPDHRKQGIALNMFERAFPHLQDSGARRILLEVVTGNRPAINLYQKLGFTFRNTFRCYKWEGSPMGKGGTNLKFLRKNEWEPSRYRSFRSYEPSFLDSDHQVPFHFHHELLIEAHLEHELAGYILFNPKSGRISQWATRPDLRNRGIGKSLLDKCHPYLGKKEFTLLNVPESDNVSHPALLALGFKNQVDQYEMELLI